MKHSSPIILTIFLPFILIGCQAEKLADDLGVHMELEIDKPSDLPPSPPSLSDKEIKEMIEPKVKVEEKKS
jgi:hypothetical protein